MRPADISLSTPLTKADVKHLVIGDILELSGVIYTARDAAHNRIFEELRQGGGPPVDFTNQFIFYAGPSPARPGRVIGSIAPTTSARMDIFLEMTFKLGLLGTIGKGERSPRAAELCKQYGGIYLLSVGGASALIASQVQSCEAVAYEDLQTESIKRLYVNKMRLIVGIDTEGREFCGREVEKYKI